MLDRTSGLLADLTDCAAMVVGPSHESATVRSVQLVGLAPRRALLVVVLSDGAVQKHTLDLPGDTTDAHLAAAGVHLTAAVRGRSMADLPPNLTATSEVVVDAAAAAGLAGLSELGDAGRDDQVFVGGSSRMAAAFDAVETVRSVLTILEQQLVVVSMLRDVLGRGLSVAIGAEHGYEPLASCAIVVMPVSVAGEKAGTIGLLGPTRMNYPQALAAARVVGERLGERLGEQVR
jgi:heat-inducible transcriptional repressor